MRDGPRAVGIALMTALAASQAALVVLNPLLPDVARDLGVSVATAGQVRTASGLAAGLAALTSGLWATRLGLRGLLFVGVGTLAVGSLVSALAPDFPVLVAAQVLAGFGIGISYSAAVAATAEWASATERSRVLAIALLGPPLAWIVGMPLVGAVGEVSWRLAWLVIPVSMALIATVLLLQHRATPPASSRAGLRTVFGYPGVLRWSAGELLAFSGWAGALVYVPGNFLFRRWVDAYSRRLLVALAVSAAVTVAVLYALRPSVWFSVAAFAVLSFIAGGRTLAGSARGLGLAPEVLLGVTGVRSAALQSGYFVGAALGGLALASGGYSLVGAAFAALFLGAAIPHLVPLRSPP